MNLSRGDMNPWRWDMGRGWGGAPLGRDVEVADTLHALALRFPCL